MRAGYREADKVVVFHENDPDLTPIVLSLPDPPPYELIDGYGLKPMDQYFKRLTIPPGLQRLEERAIEELKEESRKNKAFVITLYKIQKRFWDILETEKKKFAPEIAFIKRVWYHRVNGYWFYNFGKPTWITGLHFDYLNFWTMSTEGGDNRPDYRDRNRKEYIFKEYAFKCTETFKTIDKDGYAIDTGGKYEMTDQGIRLMYGVIQPKNRRGGNTNMGLSDGFNLLLRGGELTDGIGVMSESGDKAEEAYKVKILPAYKKFPLWIKPLTKSLTDEEIIFDADKNDYGAEGLGTKLTYATTMDGGFYDSKKLMYAFMDEEGKTKTSIVARWDIIKNCLSQGNGRLIHGFTYHPSTVEEMAEGANDFAYLFNTSDFYQRMPDGKTFSGLLGLFIPASEGLDGFIDKFGLSVKDEILPYQRELGHTMCAHDYLQSERDALLRDGSPDAMQKYRHLKKLFPLQVVDSFLGETGDIGFDYEKIDKRMPEIRNNPRVLRGNLRWVDDVFGGKVEFYEDVEQGRFQLSKLQPIHLQERIREMQYSVFAGDEIPMFAPRFPGTNVLGADPFRFTNKQQAQIASRKSGRKSRLSDGGMAVLECYNPAVDGDKPKSEWQTHRFVLSYRSRSSNSDAFNEDVLMAAIYTGSMVYPENNVETTFEYFIRHGFGGYLLYDIDPISGQMKDKPGVFNLETSKLRLFSLLRDYLHFHSHKEEFFEFLKECKDIRGMEEMRMYDRLTAHGMALMAEQSITPYRIMAAGFGDDEDDLSKFIDVFTR